VERLRIQSDAWAPDTAVMLSEIGVSPGWKCLDLACGPGGITDSLALRAGAQNVTGLDADPEFLDIARDWGPIGSTYLLGDAYETGLPAGSFDLVHMRFLASTAGDPDRLIAEALRILKPGGTLAMQEATFETLRCYPPHPAWNGLLKLFSTCFPGHEGEPVSQQLFRKLRAAGCQDVHYRPRIVGTRSGDPWADYLPATVESLRGSIFARNLASPERLEQLLSDCRRHLADPDTVFTSITCVQVWGRKAG
jgi:SAM-dependent methyltransferase